VVDEEFSQNLMQQVHELWINPEIERRREAGRLPDDFALTSVQVIMNLDADAPEVRFNEEVKVLAEAEWYGLPPAISGHNSHFLWGRTDARGRR
jgi:hypothetical protein